MAHTSDLRNVNEGDDVTLILGEGREYDAHCKHRDRHHAAPVTGEVRQTDVWEFVSEPEGYTLLVSITNGLKGRDDDPDFPRHGQVWNNEKDRGEGFITSLQIHGSLA